MAKEAKLKNSAPIKYQIEVSAKYWENIFKRERITDPKKMQDRVVEEKRKIIDFLTGAENSGKALVFVRIEIFRILTKHLTL